MTDLRRNLASGRLAHRMCPLPLFSARDKAGLYRVHLVFSCGDLLQARATAG